MAKMYTSFAAPGTFGKPKLKGPVKGAGPLLTSMAPAAPQAPGQPPAAPSAPDVRDPQYWQDLAGLEQYYQSQKAGIGAASAQDQLALQRAMTMLGEQQPRDAQTLKQNENKQGLFYSGHYGQAQGDLETNYARQRESVNTNFTNAESARQRQSADLEQLYGPNGLNRSQSMLSAVDRQAGRDQTYGVPVPAAMAAPVAAPTAQVSLLAQVQHAQGLLAKQLATRSKRKVPMGLGGRLKL